MLLLAIAGAVVLSAAVCGDGERGDGDRGDEPTAVAPPPSLTPVAISWDEVVDHIMSCNAVSAFQTHSRYVQIELRDGSQVSAEEPRLDDMFRVFEDARDGGCEPIPLATE